METAKKVNLKYKKLKETIGNLKIYEVDEFEIRNKSRAHQEFSNYGMYDLFPDMIPKNEVWVSKRVKPEEYPYLKEEFLNYIKFVKQGVNPYKAYEEALTRERNLRRSSTETKKYPEHYDKESFRKIYKEKLNVKSPMLTKMLENCKVYLVDGIYVRNFYKIDFVDGGHGYVYDFVPKNEIWIEEEVPVKERILVLLHEAIERYLMKYKNFGYLKAHNAATKLEWKIRSSEDFKQAKIK